MPNNNIIASDLFVDWDENVNGNRDSRNLLIFRRGQPLYRMTKNILPWLVDDLNGDQTACLPSAYVEFLFKYARVDTRANLKTHTMLEKCLKAEYLKTALDLLADEGLFVAYDEDGNEIDKDFNNFNHLASDADALVSQLSDNPALQVNEDSWEWASRAHRYGSTEANA